MDLGGWNRVCLGSGGVAFRHPSHFGDECDITGQLCRAFGAASLMALPAPCGSPEHIGFGALAFLGIALLSSPSLRVGGAQLWGDALALITATFYAAYLVAVAAARERIRASALALASSVLSSLALVTFVPLGGERLLPPVAVDWIWLIGLAVISQVFGQTAIAHALGRIPPAQAAIGLPNRCRRPCLPGCCSMNPCQAFNYSVAHWS
jgi:EamA-like transporter family